MTEQALDLIVRNGRVINPAENVDAVLDVGVQEGRIAAIGPAIETSPETRTLDASGCLVLPGLIAAIHGARIIVMAGDSLARQTAFIDLAAFPAVAINAVIADTVIGNF